MIGGGRSTGNRVVAEIARPRDIGRSIFSAEARRKAKEIAKIAEIAKIKNLGRPFRCPADCFQYQLVKAGGQFSYNFDSVIAQNLFMIDLYDPAIAALLS